MARALIDDCFAHDPKRLPAAEALALLRARVRTVVGSETVPLAQAHGRILAEPVVSDRDVPGFDNVAVDGFAFAHDALMPDRPTRLPLAAGRAAAGHPFAERLAHGMALRVLTGAPMPDGADSVLMQEDVSIEGDAVVIPAGVRRGANRRKAGEDMRRGQIVLQPGLRLRPQDVGVAASAGRGALDVFRPLRVALISTGDELCEPGEPLPPGGTYDANRTILLGLLQGLGCEVHDFGILPDRADAVDRAMLRAAEARCRGDLGRRLARRRGPRGARGRAPGQAAFLADRGQAGAPARLRPAGRLHGDRPAGQSGGGGDLLPALRPAGPDSARRRSLAGAARLCRCPRISPWPRSRAGASICARGWSAGRTGSWRSLGSSAKGRAS